MSGWKILGAVAALAIVAVVAVGLLMYFRLVPIPGPILALLVGVKEPEYSARFYPAGTIAYGWMTLLPGEGQVEDMQEIWDRLNEYPGFQDFLAETKVEFQTETGIDFDEEVLSWVGPEISGGVIDFNFGSERITAAVTVGVRDEGAAEVFLDKWLDYMEDESNADFARNSHEGVTTWADESAYQAYALTGDWLVYATDEATLIAVMDRIGGDDDDSLANTAKFAEARAALPERRFHSGYVDSEEVLERLDEPAEAFGQMIPGVIGPATFAQEAPAWVALSGSWVQRGIVVEMLSPTVRALGLQAPNLTDPAAILADDTFGFMAASFDPNVDNWRRVLSEYDLRDVLPGPDWIDDINSSLGGMTPDGGPALSHDATVADALDLGFSLAKQFTGMDLERDFLGHLAGEMIVAVREFDFKDVSADPTFNAVDATVMLSYNEDGGPALADTMEDVGGLLTNFAGLVPERVDVGGDNDAAVFDLSWFEDLLGDRIGYRPGWVLHDGYLTIGSTEDTLSSTVELQNGGGNSLASDPEFQRAVTHLPTERQFLGYVAVDRIVDQIDADDVGLESDRFRVIEEALGVVALGSDIGTEYSSTVTVLTLFPE